MRKVFIIVMGLLLINCGAGTAFAQTAAPANPAGVKQVDINGDGTADVTYHHDGANIHKVEADTNNDGKADVIVNKKDGKFESAEVDTDYDGTSDKKFTDATEFNKWLNENRPGFNDALSPGDLSTLGGIKF